MENNKGIFVSSNQQKLLKQEKKEKKKKRREFRLERFARSREQTKRNQGCHNCYWLDRSFGQSPCKSCKRFDSARKHDKFKQKK